MASTRRVLPLVIYDGPLGCWKWLARPSGRVRPLGAQTVGNAIDGVAPAAMEAGEGVEQPLVAGVKPSVGPVHVGPQRVAAIGRDIERVEHRAERRLFEEAEIGMPGAAEDAD